MVRQITRGLVAWVAFATLLLIPLRAGAVILPVCDAREHASIVIPPPPPRDLSCEAPITLAEGAAAAEEAAGSNVAALCDFRGASAIAPPRILPIVDARIEAAPCAADRTASPVAGPGSSGSHTVSPPAVADLAVLQATPVVPPPMMMSQAPAYPAAAGQARRGVVRDVLHVPRA